MNFLKYKRHEVGEVGWLAPLVFGVYSFCWTPAKRYVYVYYIFTYKHRQMKEEHREDLRLCEICRYLIFW